jgi:hypothetical protein
MPTKMLVSLSELVINDNAQASIKSPVNGVVAITWKIPNYDQPILVASPIKTIGIVAKNAFLFPDRLSNDRIIFKTKAEDASSLEVEFILTKDATTLDKLVEALLQTGIDVMEAGTGGLPWVGAALSVILKDAEISKEKVIRIGRGFLDIDETVIGSTSIKLYPPDDIPVKGRNPSTETLEPPIDRVISKKDVNGTLTLNFESHL